MKILKSLFAVAVALFLSAFIGTAIADHIGTDPAQTSVILFALPFVYKLAVYAYLGFMPAQSRHAHMAVQQEFWVDYVLANLFKDNSFLTKCYRDDKYVMGGSVVHIPYAGAKPVVTKNRSSYPATVVIRTDLDVTYPLDYYTTAPTQIAKDDLMAISYDKIDSVLGEHVLSLVDSICDEILVKWSPTTAARILRTTGAADGIALAPSATGTRNALLGKDLRRAQAVMDKENFPQDERYALIPVDMLTQLLSDTTLTNRDYQKDVDLKNGVVARLYGFNILTRSSAAIYDASATPQPKATAAAGAATDNLSVLCWQRNAVTVAKGDINFFERQNDPLYYGDVYSAGVKMGGRIRRNLAEGVVVIVQQ